MAVLITTNNEIKVVSGATGEAFTLDELQGYVGGYFETVRLPFVGIIMLKHQDRDATTVYEVTDCTLMLVNEDGDGLPPNVLASKLYPQGVPVLGDVLLVEVGSELT